MRRLLPCATLGLLLGLTFGPCACSSPSKEAGQSPAAAGTSGSTVGCNEGDGDVYAPGLKKSGIAGHFDFTLVSSTPEPPALQDNRFVLQITDSDGNALEGDLSVALDMPEHGHPSPKQPDIRFDAESRTFSLDPMRLFMVGLWRITFDFEERGSDVPLTDSAVFEFCID